MAEGTGPTDPISSVLAEWDLGYYSPAGIRTFGPFKSNNLIHINNLNKIIQTDRAITSFLVIYNEQSKPPKLVSDKVQFLKATIVPKGEFFVGFGEK